MTEPETGELFPASEPADPDRSTGLLPSQLLREAVALGREILSPEPIGDDQIQPASIDLRLGEVAYRVRASFLPGARSRVREGYKGPLYAELAPRSFSILVRAGWLRTCRRL